jgi:hypothetical protein
MCRFLYRFLSRFVVVLSFRSLHERDFLMATLGVLVVALVVSAALVLRPGLDRLKVVGFVLAGGCGLVCLLILVAHIHL